jgi:predicted transglutaminase-like cysteine proteinase
MLRVDRARALPCVLGIVLAVSLTAAGCGGALASSLAKSRVKKQPLEQADPLSVVRHLNTSYAGAATPPPVRFFTINAVLAKHDGLASAKSGGLQVASIDIASDGAPAVRSDAPPAIPLPQVTSEEPFGLFAFRAPEGLLWQKWRGVEAKMSAEASEIAACRSDDAQCGRAARKFIAMMASASNGDVRSRVEAVNRNVNQAIRYVSDYEQHGVADLWSSPLETLASGAGDCEDYAIAKFAVLQAAGIPEKDLKLLLVRDLAVRQDHAVLAVRVDGRWLVLDNRRMAPIETGDLPEFMPLFAINHDGVSLFAAPYAERPRHESEMDVLPAADVEGAAVGGPTLPLLL